MAQLTPNFNFLSFTTSNQDPNAPSIASVNLFARMLQSLWQQLALIINGHIGYGNSTTNGNIDGVWLSAAFSSTNTNTSFTHNLGRVPVGYLVMAKSASMDVYTGSVTWTTTTISLRSTVAATATLFVV